MLTDDYSLRKFDPILKERLDCRERRKLDPERVLDYLPLKSVDTVADIGAGTGFFTLPLARRLSEGRVLALDISSEVLATLKEKVALGNMSNIEPMVCGENDFPVEPGSLDGLLLFFVLHEAMDRLAFLNAAKAILKTGGWVAVLEWRVKPEDSSAFGPPRKVRVSREEAICLVEEAGFEVVTSADVSSDYYMLILRG